MSYRLEIRWRIQGECAADGRQEIRRDRNIPLCDFDHNDCLIIVLRIVSDNLFH
jgi:hypothetical protein